jgi:hypothetical protein
MPLTESGERQQHRRVWPTGGHYYPSAPRRPSRLATPAIICPLSGDKLTSEHSAAPGDASGFADS